MGVHDGQSPGQHASRRNLQVDFSGSGGSRTGRSPSVSPDRGVTPTSPYSVPQIAPMPSSKLCPVCTTTELSNPPAVPNYNTCTQCKATVCNQCGFNPNPHLTEAQQVAVVPSRGADRISINVLRRDTQVMKVCVRVGVH
ncbi:protein bassoon-like protein [Lates japonicus]|uniref:Protein bassoon-like protein n=1 Tax=Lates japonicus TaxID=270547 RepID=A0AAD3RMB7_LATJO|nr:protein bassoon-like protein [Lates japonicus]